MRSGCYFESCDCCCLISLAVLEGHGRPVKCLAVAVDSNNVGGPGGDNENSSSSYLVYSGTLDYDINVWRIRVPLL